MTQPPPTCWLCPERVWIDGRLAPDLAVGLGVDGRIGAVVPVDALPDGAPRRPLPRRALLPGFVNAHSHAFQRGFRGQTEFLHAGRQAEDFWSWRTLMYEAAAAHDPESVYRVALPLYREMLAAGFTSVGEFHYLHHRPDGAPYGDPLQMSRAVVQAALDAGMRICLLLALYHTGGVGRPAEPHQRRFVSPDLDSYLRLVEAALAEIGGLDPRASVGMAPHSIRAVPLPWIKALADFNRPLRLPVHMHLCEQPAEVRDCVAALGVPPIEALLPTGVLTPDFVAVHATHLAPDDPRRLADAGARVCACPTTEANLGDGLLPGLTLLSHGVPLCIGSDSHIAVSPFEELRMIENNERLRLGRRNVLAAAFGPDPAAPDRLRVAPGLLKIGALEGARALGVDAGEIAAGRWADLVAVDLDDLALAGVPPEALPEALVFSAGPRCVARVWVGGAEVFDADQPRSTATPPRPHASTGER